LRKDCRELYPGEQFLRLACNAGVAIAFGSDAHKPEEVGLDFSMAVRAAKQAGYAHYSVFNLRNRQFQGL
ncbi:MAG: hypothetical protein RMH97_11180, partial [Verrucomicrobiales bacterium]|nr:hypothetical protein [Verrucomicrobiales bacterium]